MSEKIVVCGAGGYVGRHLVADLVKKGHKNVFAVSRNLIEVPEGATWSCVDLLDSRDCQRLCEGATRIYNLAATVGGIGFIQKNAAACMTSAAININLLRARSPELQGYFFASSSCVYPSSPTPLREGMVRPGELTGYGLEKFYSEQVALAFAEDNGVPVRIARLHTIAGPGDFRGGLRDHFPSALALKVAEAKHSGRHEINIFGDGTQTRSLLYIDDAVEGIQRIMNSSASLPMNLASSEIVSVNGLVTMLEDIAAVKLIRFYSGAAPVGAQHKTTDNLYLRAAIGWEPCTPARVVMERIYNSAWDKVIKG